MVQKIRGVSTKPYLACADNTRGRVLRHVCAVFLPVVVVLVACGQNEPAPACRPFVISNEFVLAADRVALGSLNKEADPGSCASLGGIRSCSYSDGRLIRIYLENETTSELAIDWATAKYTDEVGIPHRLVPFPDPLPNSEMIPAGQGRWQTMVPEEKRSFNVTEGIRHQVIDQFLPFDVRCVRREDLFGLVERDIVPLLAMNVAVNNEPILLTIDFRLEQTDIATFQIQRSQASREGKSN